MLCSRRLRFVAGARAVHEIPLCKPGAAAGRLCGRGRPYSMGERTHKHLGRVCCRRLLASQSTPRSRARTPPSTPRRALRPTPSSGRIGIGILTDSLILIIGAMVVGPEFGPLAGLCVAVVQRELPLA